MKYPGQCRFGPETIPVRFPEAWPVETLVSPGLNPRGTDLELVESALDNPIGSPRLGEIVGPGEEAVIVVSDLSRVWHRPAAFLPSLLGRLNRAGIGDEAITILVATGTHLPHSEAEHRLVVGEEVFSRVRVVSHDCRDAANLVEVGHTSSGRPVLINRLAVEAQRLILTGAITHHSLAGFAGGVKSILPGVAGLESIRANHRLCLDSEGRIRPQVHEGACPGNPVWEDMAAAAKLIRADFLLNVIVGGRGRYLAAVAGEPAGAHARGCALAGQAFEVPLEGRADLVVASVGGAPRDAELFQSVKALSNAGAAAGEGGTIILASFCERGTGPEEWLDWFRLGSRERVVERLLTDFTIPGFVALKVMDLARRCRLILVSSLNPETVRLCWMEPASSLAQALARVGGKTPQRVIWMPSASTTVPKAG